MATAFKATFRLKGDGLQKERTFGLNSEFDALPVSSMTRGEDAEEEEEILRDAPRPFRFLSLFFDFGLIASLCLTGSGTCLRS